MKEVPDDAGEWDEAWNEEVGAEITAKQSLIDAKNKLNRLNDYLDELYELNGTSLSWDAAIKKMKMIIMEEQRRNMTPEEKITELVEYIKKEFPKGCDTAKCEDCPLLMFISDYDTIEYNICEMLSRTESGPSI